MTQRNVLLAAVLVTAVGAPASVLACSSCGCSLSSDWSSQGIAPSGGGFRADFRFESFNIFNRHAFSAGSNSLDGNTFGKVTSASGARDTQLALKIYW